MKRLAVICTLFIILAATFAAAPSVRADLEAQVTGCAFGVNPRLVIGGQGRVTPGLSNRIRNAPSLNGSTVGQIPATAIFTVLSGPVCSANIGWWQVNYNGIVGWTAEGQNGVYWLEPYTINACPMPTRLSAGQQGRVTPGLPNTLRSDANFNAGIVGQIPAGGVFTVIEGPRCSSNVNWWRVNYNGIIAWTAEGQNGTYWLEPFTAPLPQCTLLPRLGIGGQGRVTPGLPNLIRSQPNSGAGSAIVGRIPGNGVFTVLSGPSCDGAGRLWWQVNYNGVVGWTPEGQGSVYWVEPYAPQGGICPLPGRMVVGRQGYVLPGLPNALRSQPYSGGNSTVLGYIPGSAIFTVIGGPSCDDQNRLWWQVNYNGVVGWTGEGEGNNYWIAPL